MPSQQGCTACSPSRPAAIIAGITAEPAAAVEHHPQPVLVAQIDQAAEVRQDEAAEQRQAQQRAGLAAQIVADEEDVDRAGGRRRKSAG